MKECSLNFESPSTLEDEVLFESARICCVCHNSKFRVQIHHIDGNHQNNSKLNLAVLCLDCHWETQIKGGFDRKLTPGQVILFRDSWVKTVKDYRNSPNCKPNESIQLGETFLQIPKDGSFPNEIEHLDNSPFSIQEINFVIALPKRLYDLQSFYKAEIDTGVTSNVVQSVSKINEFLLESLKRILLSFFPNHFPNGDEQVDSLLKDLFDKISGWHWMRLNPDGPNSGGSMKVHAHPFYVQNEIKGKISDLVREIFGEEDFFNYKAWETAWNQT